MAEGGYSLGSRTERPNGGDQAWNPSRDTTPTEGTQPDRGTAGVHRHRGTGRYAGKHREDS
jgi:hypothetical protein